MRRFSLLLLLFALPAWGKNIFVDPNNPQGYDTIAQAVQEADEGDVVFVAEGFYPESITIDKNLHLIGAGADKTILSYAQSGHAINLAAGLDTTTHIEGFTITAKGGDGINMAERASATIRSCLFTRCAGWGISLNQSESIIQLNQFVENQGGGLYLYRDQGSLITNNLFKGNLGGRAGWGDWKGVVFFLDEATKTIFANNLLKGNQARVAIYSYGGSPTIRNNAIVENTQYGIVLMGQGYGSRDNPAPLITSNIIANNTSGGIYLFDGTPVVSYNDVYNNTTDYTSVTPDIGDISKDPKFADPRKDDYHLLTGSPCIDTGIPGAANFDPDGTRCDMGIYGGPFARFWKAPYVGPVVTSLEVTPSRVQQGGTITVRATGTTVGQ